MNVRWSKSAPILMNQKILQEAVLEQLSPEEAQLITGEDGFHFGEIFELRLEYKNILRIGHLMEFTSLERLELNNNIIEKIGGLDCLVNLTWLNLSFNNIEKIEGLQCLCKLEVLNLTSNKISVIENMDNLEKLTHFSIANNLLGQLDNVLYLRKFKNLFSLDLFGNPACEDGSYKLYIAAYFPKLISLDHRLLDKKTKEEAFIKYQHIIDEIRREELQMQQTAEVNQKREAEVKLHLDAFVELLNGSYLYNGMLKDDPEAEKLQSVPGVAPLLQTFEQQLVQLCMQLFQIGLIEHEQRETAMSSFFSSKKEAVTECQQKSTQTLSQFEQQHNERILELSQLSDQDLKKDGVDHCNDEIKELSNTLMTLEFQLVSQLENIFQNCDINVSDMVANFCETAQGIFDQCRDLEEEYHEKVLEIAVATLENVAKADLADLEDISEDVEMLFKDEEKVMKALATSHDNHLAKIADRETQLVTRVNDWKEALFKEIEEKVQKQQHMRISGIQRYMDHLKEQTEKLL